MLGSTLKRAIWRRWSALRLRRGKSGPDSIRPDCPPRASPGIVVGPQSVALGGRPRFRRIPWRPVLGAGDRPATERHVLRWSFARGVPERPGRRKAACSWPHGCGSCTRHSGGRPAVGGPGTRRRHPPRGSATALSRVTASLAGRRRGGSARSPRNSLRGFGGTPPRDPQRARSGGREPRPRFLHRGSCRDATRQRGRNRRGGRCRVGPTRGAPRLQGRPMKILRAASQ
jgi:hypothetical protein